MMKKKIVPSTRFKKDKKRYINDFVKMKKLYGLLSRLEKTGRVPAE